MTLASKSHELEVLPPAIIKGITKYIPSGRVGTSSASATATSSQQIGTSSEEEQGAPVSIGEEREGFGLASIASFVRFLVGECVFWIILILLIIFILILLVSRREKKRQKNKGL